MAHDGASDLDIVKVRSKSDAQATEHYSDVVDRRIVKVRKLETIKLKVRQRQQLSSDAYLELIVLNRIKASDDFVNLDDEKHYKDYKQTNH